MTDIKVGSLWELYGVWRVVAVTKNYVFFEALDGHEAKYWDLEYFERNAKPYTPPKEYKVWVYEAKDGKSGHTFKKKKWGGADRAGMKLVAVRDIKEGDGL